MSGTEIIDVLSPDGAVLKQMPRDLAESENYMSANVLIFLFDPLGRVWVQLRPTDKKHFGGLWDITACGGILSAESAIDAAVRETREETSLEPDLQHVETFIHEFINIAKGQNDRKLSHLYISITADIPQISAEADDFKLWELGELMADVRAEPHKYVPPFLFELEKAIRAHDQMVSARQTK